MTTKKITSLLTDMPEHSSSLILKFLVYSNIINKELVDVSSKLVKELIIAGIGDVIGALLLSFHSPLGRGNSMPSAVKNLSLKTSPIFVSAKAEPIEKSSKITRRRIKLRFFFSGNI